MPPHLHLGPSASPIRATKRCTRYTNTKTGLEHGRSLPSSPNNKPSANCFCFDSTHLSNLPSAPPSFFPPMHTHRQRGINIQGGILLSVCLVYNTRDRLPVSHLRFFLSPPPPPIYHTYVHTTYMCATYPPSRFGRPHLTSSRPCMPARLGASNLTNTHTCDARVLLTMNQRKNKR